MLTVLYLLTILGIFSGIFLFYRAGFIQPKSPSRYPFVSVIIPARNEEKNIAKLLSSLNRSTYPNLEVIVVDDKSTDRTSSVAKSFGAKVIKIEDRVEGFLGKPFACFTGYKHAKGEILIFVDADVELHEEAIGSIVEEVLSTNGVVSIWPRHVIKTPYENLSMIFAIISAMASKSFSIIETSKPMGLYGPLIATPRESYELINGHESVKGEVVEDFKLGKKFVEKNIPVHNFLGGNLVKFRMYPEGLIQLINGWGKNSALGSATVSLEVILPIAFFLLGSLVPVFYYSVKPLFYLYFAYVFLLYIFAKRVGEFSLFAVILYPVIVLFTLFVITYSFYATFIRGFVEWKDVHIPTRK